MSLVLSAGILLLVLVGAMRTVLERKFPYVRRFSAETHWGYLALVLAAASLLISTHYVDISRVQTVEIPGLKVRLNDVQQKVDTLSTQVEALFKLKKIETFDGHNWKSKARRVSPKDKPVRLEVSLELPPIPGSIEVYEGVLLMPEQSYTVSGNRVSFVANGDTPDLGLTVKYYPVMSTLNH